MSCMHAQWCLDHKLCSMELTGWLFPVPWPLFLGGHGVDASPSGFQHVISGDKGGIPQGKCHAVFSLLHT